MKNILTSLILLSSFALANESAKKPELKDLKHPRQAVLWKIEGKDLKKPSFLFGTIHLSDPRLTTLHPLAEKAFQKSDVIYTEIDLTPESRMASAPKLMRQDGKKLSDSVGPEIMMQLDAPLQKINPALNATPFEPMKTWVIATVLPALEDQLNGKAALDLVLFQRAAEEVKKRDSLETVDSQLKIFDQFSEEEQVKIFKNTITHMEEAQKEIGNMVKIYLTGNANDIAGYLKKYMEKSKGSELASLQKRLMKLMLDDRNKTMSVVMIKKLNKAPEKAHFFAVGAAHYTGKTAIQKLLKKKIIRSRLCLSEANYFLTYRLWGDFCYLDYFLFLHRRLR